MSRNFSFPQRHPTGCQQHQMATSSRTAVCQLRMEQVPMAMPMARMQTRMQCWRCCEV